MILAGYLATLSTYLQPVSYNDSCRQRPSNLAVRVGSFHRQEQDPDQADIAVTEVRLHEDYDPWVIQKYPDV